MNAQSRSFLTDNGEWMLNAIKRNPEGLLLLAAGAVLMLRTGARASGAAQPSMAADYGQKPETYSGAVRKTFDAAVGRCPADGRHRYLIRICGIRLRGQGSPRGWRAVGTHQPANAICRQQHFTKSTSCDRHGRNCRGRRHSCGVSADRP